VNPQEKQDSIRGFENNATLALKTSEPLAKQESRQGWAHLRQAEAFVYRQQRNNTESFFLWNIKNDYFKISLRNLEESYNETIVERVHKAFPPYFPKGTLGCWYSENFQPAATILEIRDRVVSEVSQSGATMGLWHVRRKDTTRACDTGLETLANYMNCSFQNSESLGGIVVLLMSDEVDPLYWKRWMSQFQPYPHIHPVNLESITKTHIDNYIREHPEKERFRTDNYFAFLVMEAVRKESAFVLEHRRTICPKCTELMKLKNVKWVSKANKTTPT